MSERVPNLINRASSWEGCVLPPLRMAPRAGVDPQTRYAWLHGSPRLAVRAVPQPQPRPAALQRICLGVWIALLSMLSYWLISRYVITAVEVRGRSMAPTLQDGERYFLNRLVYLWREPARGDLAVIEDPGHPDRAVKRIIGLPGEAVLIRDGQVYVNGQRLAEPYVAPGTRTDAGPGLVEAVRLGPDTYFVLGDNRACSEDSRHYGPVHRRQIVGLIAR